MTQVSVLQILAKKANLAKSLVEGPKFPLIGSRIGERVEGFTGTKESFADKMVRDLASYKTKVHQLDNYNAAIILANNLTRVRVGGVEVTVAEAIASRKIHQNTFSAFIHEAKKQIAGVNNLVSRSLMEIEAQMDKQKTALSTGGKTASEETLRSMRADIEKANLREVVNPNVLEALLAEYQEQFEELDQAFNMAIQEANAKVMVEVDDRGFVDLSELRTRLTQQ